MSSWKITCAGCGRQFVQSEVADNVTDFFRAVKPVLDSSGEAFRCPFCGCLARYKRSDLSYSRLSEDSEFIHLGRN